MQSNISYRNQIQTHLEKKVWNQHFLSKQLPILVNDKRLVKHFKCMICTLGSWSSIIQKLYKGMQHMPTYSPPPFPLSSSRSSVQCTVQLLSQCYDSHFISNCHMLSLIDYINHSNTSQFTEGVNFLGDTRLFFFQTGKTISCIKTLDCIWYQQMGWFFRRCMM